MRYRLALLTAWLFISPATADWIRETSRDALAAESPRVPLGFSPQGYEAQRKWEKRFLEIPSAGRCRKYLRRLTREPHVAGTPGDRRVTQFIFDEFQRAGLKPKGTLECPAEGGRTSNAGRGFAAEYSTNLGKRKTANANHRS